MELKLELDADPGTFYELGNGFFLPLCHMKFLTSVKIEDPLPVRCMFDISLVTYEGERVGFYLTTRFTVKNAGGYLLTYLQSKGEATEVEVLIRTDDLIVYNYPNRGSLAVTPLVSDKITTIFEEQ